MRRLLGLGMLAVALGCGSGGTGNGTGGISGGGGGAGGAGACVPVGGKLLSWFENGARQCAISVSASHAVSGEVQLLQIGGGVTSGSFAFVITTMGPIGGVYTCGSSATGFPSVLANYNGTAATTCTIDVTNSGTPGVTNASGTFTATFTGGIGVPPTITSGVFDTPVTGS